MAKKKQNLHSLKPTRSYHLMYCPECHHIFSVKDMWMALSRDFDSVWTIMEKLRVGWNVVRRAVEKWGVPLRVTSTPTRAFYERVSRRCGYWSFEDMLYDLRVTKRMTYKRMAGLLGMDDWRSVREACLLLNPAKRKEILRNREYWGYGRLGRVFSRGESSLIPSVVSDERKRREAHREKLKKSTSLKHNSPNTLTK